MPRMRHSRSDWSLTSLANARYLSGSCRARRAAGRRRTPAPDVRFAAHAIGVLAADIERILEDRHVAEGRGVASTVSSPTSRRPMPSICVCVPVKYFSTNLERQADGVEDLRAAV